MSKENVLKKQFAEKDVNRLRNLVKGKYADKSTASVGFTKGQEGPHWSIVTGKHFLYSKT